jgi:hypothetical protein
VRNPSKTNIRIVFDGAAKFHGTALNEHLMQGHDLTNSLTGVLMRFRREPVALTADIKAMFHQVKVPKEDQSALRFLWWPDGDTHLEPTDYAMTRHVFGLRSSPSCAAFALRQTADDHKASFSEEAVEYVHRNFYVDDLQLSLKSTKDASTIMQELRSMLSLGGFELVKWMSNDKAVLSTMPSDLRAPHVRTLDTAADALPCTKTLRVGWNADADTFQFKIATSPGIATKRCILSTIAAIYDPLGFVSPVVLEGKQILQELTCKGLGWDQQTPRERVVLKAESTGELLRRQSLLPRRSFCCNRSGTACVRGRLGERLWCMRLPAFDNRGWCHMPTGDGKKSPSSNQARHDSPTRTHKRHVEQQNQSTVRSRTRHEADKNRDVDGQQHDIGIYQEHDQSL